MGEVWEREDRFRDEDRSKAFERINLFFAPLDEIFWFGFPFRLLEKGVGNRRNVFNESTIVGSQLYKKDCNSTMVLGLTKFLIASTFVGSGATPSSEMMFSI